MIKLPINAKKLKVPNTTVDFFSFIEESKNYFYFDSSLTAPPEPMVNANSGLSLLKNKNDFLIMINHKIPMALLNRVELLYDVKIEELKNENVEIIFQIKE